MGGVCPFLVLSAKHQLKSSSDSDKRIAIHIYELTDLNTGFIIAMVNN